MALTLNEAREQAARVWGDAVTDVAISGGKVLVQTDPSRARAVAGARCSQFQFHSLDVNGHPLCHTECEKHESQLAEAR